MLEQVWNTDLSSFDAEGPLPPFDPDPESPSIIQGRARMYDDPVVVARKWRALAEERHLSIRDLIIEVTGRQTFTGHAGLGGGGDQPQRAGRRVRRVHPGAAPDPGRA